MVAEGQRRETFQYLCQYYPSKKKKGRGFRIILNILFSYFKINLINLLCIYLKIFIWLQQVLVAGSWELRSSLQHMRSLVAACELLVWHVGSSFQTRELNLGPPALGLWRISHWTIREFPDYLILKAIRRNSLAAQWLGLCGFTTVGLGLIPAWRSKILQVACMARKKKRKNCYKKKITLDLCEVIQSGKLQCRGS